MGAGVENAGVSLGPRGDRPQQVLVTGSAGFIGRAVCRRLEACGHQVRKIDNLSSPAVLPVDADTVRMEVTDLGPTDFDGVDCVIHLAAKKSVPLSFLSNEVVVHNVALDSHLLQTAAGRVPGPVLIASSCEVYGNQGGALVESAAVRPISPYAVSKAAAEQLAHVHRLASPGTRIAALRLFNVYGPESGGGAVVAEFIDGLRQHGTVRVEGSGLQRRDFSHVETVSRMIVDLASVPDLPAVVNVGSGRAVRIIDVARQLIRVHGSGAVRFARGRTNEIDVFVAETSLLTGLGVRGTSRDLVSSLGDVYEARVSGFLDERADGALVRRAADGAC